MAMGPALPPHAQSRSAPGRSPLAAALAATAALVLYFLSLAPGLTWAHHGADGGELLAAAVVNGVPHPPGYPLYTPLLRTWLLLTGIVAPASDLAWRGNLLSAVCGALAVFVSVVTLHALLEERKGRSVIAATAGLLWGASPLLWSQSILTEVYAFHALLVALLGWAALVASERRLWPLALPVALGAAHHLTLLLLTPAALYVVWARRRSARALVVAAGWIVAGALCGSLLYLRIPLAARAIPPVNWGYATDAAGLWWLISGAAYRSYLFAAPAASLLQRIAAWAYTLAVQYTWLGLGLALWGLAWWDQNKPLLRNFSLLWFAPISIYTIGYASRDSEVYLIPVTWLMGLWLATGMERCLVWLERRYPGRRTAEIALGSFVALAIVVIPLRWGDISLRSDQEAMAFLAAAAESAQPNAIIVSRGDEETFALWYGTWASGEITRAAPGVVLVNDSLYQFDWYQRLQNALHPDTAGAGESAEALIEANLGRRPILVTGDMMGDGAVPPGIYPYSPP